MLTQYRADSRTSTDIEVRLSVLCCVNIVSLAQGHNMFTQYRADSRTSTDIEVRLSVLCCVNIVSLAQGPLFVYTI